MKIIKSKSYKKSEEGVLEGYSQCYMCRKWLPSQLLEPMGLKGPICQECEREVNKYYWDREDYIREETFKEDPGIYKDRHRGRLNEEIKALSQHNTTNRNRK